MKLDDTVSPHQCNFEKPLESNEQKVLSDMVEAFGNKPFPRNHVQAFDQSAMVNSYRKEEEKFLKNFRSAPQSSVPKTAKVIGCHTIYKIEMNDDSSLKLKPRIVPHSK